MKLDRNIPIWIRVFVNIVLVGVLSANAYFFYLSQLPVIETFEDVPFSRTLYSYDTNKASYQPGDTGKIALNVEVVGDDLTGLSASIDTGYETKDIDLIKDGLKLEVKKNDKGQLEKTIDFKIDNESKAGCRNVSVALQVRNEGKVLIKDKTENAKYCVVIPEKSTVHTYEVVTRGNVEASLAEFKQQANTTLNSSLGWARADLSFKEVSSGGDFTLVLSEDSEVPSYSSACSANYSCRVGRFVIINETNWLNATDSWNEAGGSLRDYRHMVVNHEVGHWLGFGHSNCGGSGQLAPVMQQQSINLQGCKFNPWPLKSEINVIS